MSEEDFLKRWSRRKRAAAEETAKAPAPPAAEEAEPRPEPVAGEDATSAGVQAPKGEEEFDVSSLPPIDSIDSASDVTAFLRKGVPTDLTRAALRRAWVADPAIRDFVGLAENSWDFNDPTAMPGFGPLDQSPEQVRAMVSQLFTTTERAIDELTEPLAETTPVPDAANESNAVASAAPPDAGPLPAPDAVQAPLDMSVASEDRTAKIAAVQNDDGDEAHAPRRSHGGALPR